MELLVVIAVLVFVIIGLICNNIEKRRDIEARDLIVKMQRDRISLLQVQANGRFGKLGSITVLAPDPKIWVAEGEAARAQGLTVWANPYKDGIESMYWLEGYYAKDASK